MERARAVTYTRLGGSRLCPVPWRWAGFSRPSQREGWREGEHAGAQAPRPPCSVWEIVGQQGGGLSVLRTFRLMRVLKLVRFLPALQRQLVVLMKTMDNVATFCMLLMLFIFIFR